MLYDMEAVCCRRSPRGGGSTWNPEDTWSDPVVFGHSAIPDWQWGLCSSNPMKLTNPKSDIERPKRRFDHLNIMEHAFPFFGCEKAMQSKRYPNKFSSGGIIGGKQQQQQQQQQQLLQLQHTQAWSRKDPFFETDLRNHFGRESGLHPLASNYLTSQQLQTWHGRIMTKVWGPNLRLLCHPSILGCMELTSYFGYHPIDNHRYEESTMFVEFPAISSWVSHIHIRVLLKSKARLAGFQSAGIAKINRWIAMVSHPVDPSCRICLGAILTRIT